MTLAVHRLSSIRSTEKGIGHDEDLDGIFDIQDPRRWSHLGLAITSDVKSNGIRSPRIEKEDAFTDWTSRTRHLSETSTSSFTTKCRSHHSHLHHKQDLMTMRKGRDSRLDEDGMSLDMALQFVGQDVFATETSINLRRKGRAIVLNDQLRFDGAKEINSFHKALLDWQDGNDDDQILCQGEDCDATILLALSRCLATREGNYNLDTPSATPALRSGQNQFHLPMRRKAASRGNHIELKTSASTPEGALGKVDLPDMIEMNDLVPEMEMLASPTEMETSEDVTECEKGRQVEVLQAALRYVLSYLDEVDNDKSREGSSDHDSDVKCRSYMMPPKMQPKQRDQLQVPSRGQSIIKKLARKRLSLHPNDKQVSPSSSISPSRSNTLTGENSTKRSSIATLSSPLLSSDLDGNYDTLPLQQERAKTCALEKELEMIREALHRQTSDREESVKSKGGNEKAEENRILLSVSQAARERAEAEEKGAMYQSQCEELQTRLETIEEALYNAIGLLAEKEEGLSITGSRSPFQSDNDADFYSAGEEESNVNTNATMDTTSESIQSPNFEEASKGTTRLSELQAQAAEEDEEEVPFPDRFSICSSSSTAVDPSSGSPKAEDLESRRSSHASWIRHTILPPLSQIPPPIPDAKVKNAVEKQTPPVAIDDIEQRAKRIKQVGITLDKPLPEISDISSKSKDTPRPLLHAKSHSILSTSEIGTLDSPWSARRFGEMDSFSSDLQRDTYTPATSVDSPSIIEEKISPRLAISKEKEEVWIKPKTTEERNETSTSCPLSSNDNRPRVRRAASHKSTTSKKSSKSEKQTGSSKYSILGHMPPMPTTSRRYKSESGFSGSSLCSDPNTSTSDHFKFPLYDHYINLHSDGNKDEDRVKSFSRRTRFRQDAFM